MVKYDRHYLKAFSKNTYFENLSKDIVKEMTGDGTTYDFNFENIPLQSYRLMVYTEADYYFVPRFNIHYLLKGKTVKFEETASSITIRKYEVDQSFLIEKKVYNKTTSLYEPPAYEGCEVFIVEVHDYSKLKDKTDYESLAAVSVASGKTDAKGETTLKVRLYRSLYAICFSPEKKHLIKGVMKYYRVPGTTQISKTIIVPPVK